MRPIPLARAAATIALAVVVALALLLAPQADVAAQDADDLVGTVIDGETKKPVVGALVSVWRDDAPPKPPDDGRAFDRLDWPKQASRSARTDARGAFAFSKEPRAALRWLSVTATGYAPEAVPTGGPGVSVSIPLEKAVVRKDRFLRCTGTGTEPAAGLEILVLSRAEGAPAPLLAARFATAADGSAAVPLGERTEAFLRGAGVATTPYRASRSPGPILLEPGGPVTGTVMSPTGAPIAGVEVQIHGAGVSGLRGRSDASGRFRIEGVACGDEGGFLTIEPLGCLPQMVQVQGGTTDLQIVASPGARVRGRLLDAAGKAVSGAHVYSIHPATPAAFPDAESDTPPGSVQTGPDGTFELAGVPPGVWTIEARTQQGLSWHATIDVHRSAVSVDAPMALSSRAASLPVRVIDHTGAPLAGVAVQYAHGDATAKTAPDGTADVPLARTLNQSVSLRLSGGKAGAEGVEATIGDTCARAGRVTIRLCPAATLRVRAKRADGTPLGKNEFVYVIGPGDEAEVPVCLGAGDGLFGNPTVLVPAGRPLHFVAIDATTLAVVARSITVDPVKGGEIDIVFPQLSVVKARLPEDFPARATRAVAITPSPASPAAPDVERSAKAGADGSIVVRDLFPGEWMLRVVCEQPPITIVAVRRETIPAAGGVLDLGALPMPAVTIQGVVRSGGAGVPGAELGVTWPGGREVPIRTLPDGRYVVRLPAGLDARIVVRSPDHGWATKPAGTGAAPVDFDLGPGATLVLRNGYHASGFPLPVEVRSAGVSSRTRTGERTDVAVVRGVAPGAVEIVVGEGKSARTIRVDAPAGKTTFVDLATAKWERAR